MDNSQTIAEVLKLDQYGMEELDIAKELGISVRIVRSILAKHITQDTRTIDIETDYNND